ncbi:MAG TPA: acyltransferase family protein, partial [Acidobacteriota bacterium]|nr:acyltransferase family protein [Acidobacteriota bacterium]
MSENAARGRMAYIDNLRWLMIVFVVLVHAAVTYSGIGGWMYIERRPLGPAAFVGFSVWQSFTQAYFMGFLFLLAGYFVPSSYDRKGFRRFLADRAFRLGVPTLFYMFVLGPFARFVLLRPESRSFGELYVRYVSSERLLAGTGPLWFAAALLVFSAVYALG